MKKIAELWKKLISSIKRSPLIWGFSFTGTVAVCVLCVFFIKSFTDRTDFSKMEGNLHLSKETSAVSEDETDFVYTDDIINPSGPRVPNRNFLVTSITAEKMTGRLTEPDSAFVLTTNRDLEADELKKLLVFEPDIRYELTKTASREFKLKSANALPPDSVVRLTLLDSDGEDPECRWAFQTTGIFRVTSVLPADGGNYVPVDTGIEITFSADVSVDTMTNYFTIEPEVNGRFVKYTKTIVFVPDSDLEEGEEYTVTVKAGISSAEGELFDKDFTFSFKTQETSNKQYFYAGGGISETFLPGDPALVELFLSSELSGKPVELTLYQYKDAESYKNALAGYNNGLKSFSAEGLTSVYTVKEEPLRVSGEYSYWRPSFIMLPDNLSEGYYLADIKIIYGKEYSTQKLIQINPVSVYMASIPNEAVFFINDTATGKAASGAKITLETAEKDFSVNTGADGTAKISLSAENRGMGIINIVYNGYHYLDCYDYRASEERKPEEDYFLYLYTDREAYRTTDEINVWGVVLPRKGNTPPPQDMYLRLGLQDTEGDLVPVNLKADGTFTAVIKIKNHTEKYWGFPLTLNTGDSVMCTKNIVIRDYVKPTYVFDIEVPFYAWMPQNNPVNLSVNATFFEGTPAENINFEFKNWSGASVQPETSFTDAYGHAETSVLVTDRDTWRPQSIETYFHLSGIENEYQRKTGTFYGLFRDVMLESDYKSGTLTVNTSMVDPTNFVPKENTEESRSFYGYNYRSNYYFDGYYNYDDYYGYNNYNDYGYNYYYSEEILRGKPVDVTVTGTLHREWWEKRETGSYYDFINKKTVTSYTYDSRKEVVGTYTINTVNGVGQFTDLPVNIPNSYYYIALEWKDTQGQRVTESRGIWNTRNYNHWRDTSIHHYNLSADSDYFTGEQNVNFQLMDNGEAVTDAVGKIFYAVSGSEFISTGVVDSPSFNYRMNEDCIPNFYMSGAYFDGRHVFPLFSNQYRYANKERELSVEITADKTQYRPGEKARVTVTVRDENGRLIPNASVSLSVVDEAAFAIQNQKVFTLSNLYAYIYRPGVMSYYSYIQHSLNESSPGEKGGGDESDTVVRRNFKDNAAFLTGTTGSNGSVVFDFELPDNLTSWRLTSQAVGNNSDGKLCAGNAKEPLIVTQPLFLTVNMLTKYTEGDDINVSARINGQVLNSTNEPKITAKLTGNGIEKTASALSNQALAFGKLPSGSYTLLISASDGINSDAVELPLEVVDSILETPVTRGFNLSELENGTVAINPLRFPVSLRFYDNEYILYGQVLNHLYCNWGERADFRVASAFARKELGFIDERQYRERLEDISASEIIRLLPYSDKDYALTALICAASPDIVSKGAVSRALYEKLSDKSATSEEVTNCYMGLAALSQPVLIDILSLLDNPVGLDESDKLRLCAALALLGDEESALKYYLELTGDITIYNSGDEIKAYISGDKNTALALITASVLNLPEAEGFVRHLMNIKSQEHTFVMEMMVYLQYYTPKIEGDAAFQYTLNGETRTVKLNRFRGTILYFGAEQLEKADFKVISGDVGCTAYYIGSVSEQSGEQNLSITKTYTPVDGSWEPGELVKVSITINNPQMNTSYNIEDVIPSGARYAGDNINGKNNYSWVTRSEQRISGYLNPRYERTFTYYIRLVTAGEYVAESAVFRNFEGNWGMSDRGTLTILQ